ncbi:MAG TPA: hypothetical protein DCZ69_01885 [Syntrophobacteraceae bacterium]|nr:hypothetical protein [Syntrophobacteraceae bacterium]HBZ56150.1 hypothetical protein [Syntrophobacteraceae bacterium]
MHFPVSGVDSFVLWPPLVAFVVSFFTSMGGVSGAFLLLPYQMSVMGYVAPSVSATNQVYNIIGIPSGVYRYIREKRMVWPLTWAVIIGTLPGVFIGAWVRVVYLPDPKQFKLFAGFVLLYMFVQLARDIYKSARGSALAKAKGPDGNVCVTDARFSLTCVEYNFAGTTYTFSPWSVLLLCFIVGAVGGIYGVGGGAIVAPFFVTIFKMPVYTVAGAALMGTFLTSLAGAAFYQALDMAKVGATAVAPDWALGALFGIGGFGGMYLGARCQKHVPASWIKGLLAVILLSTALTYIVGFFTR